MKSCIVQLNSTKEYFKVKYYLTHLVEIKMVKDKKNATLFQKDSLVLPSEFNNSQIRVGEIRGKEFNLYLYGCGIKSDDITVIEFDAPEQTFQFEDIKPKDLKKYINSKK